MLGHLTPKTRELATATRAANPLERNETFIFRSPEFPKATSIEGTISSFFSVWSMFIFWTNLRLTIGFYVDNCRIVLQTKRNSISAAFVFTTLN